MSYQVIARKYRPQRFEEVVGQEHVTTTLANAIRQNRIAHAYLFAGPRGTGKTTVARIFSKALNCTAGPKADFLDDDPRVKEITEGRSMDVMEIDGASNRGIDQIRELRETAKYVPANSKFKIYIIDEVHMLTKEAFNALLKTLEEPPDHVKFMFATTEPEKVLPTILSRCQRFDLRRIPSKLIVQHLTQIAAAEKVEIDEAALYAIARGAEGGMRDAESTLDQLISFCGSKIEEADVLSMFGLAARAQLFGLASAIIEGEPTAALRELNSLAAGGKDLGRLLSDLMSYFRNLMVFQVAGAESGFMDVSEGEAGMLREHAGKIASDSLTRVLDVLTDAESRLRDTSSKKILLEVSMLKAIEARRAVSIDTVLSKLQGLKNGGATNGPSPRPSAPTTPPAVAAKAETPPARPLPTASQSTQPPPPTRPIASQPAQESKVELSLPKTTAEPEAPGTAPTDVWQKLVEAISRASKFTHQYILETHPVALKEKSLTLGLAPESSSLGFLDNPKTRSLVEQQMAEIGYAGYSVRFVKAVPPIDWQAPVRESFDPPPAAKRPAGTRNSEAAAPAPLLPVPDAGSRTLSKEDFQNDPLIKKALELFKGTIVEVRA